ncbi:XRE family transcriptional regulator [Kribbella turkmenica]|uniref:XRE family transcriptional regulator n=1 Tax=Kribbella turkmenica TaxID=2530375 RepID=A0A4R4W6K2_9ACTN|nr:XRE family transcriptional regulator [Kribbella turkmenica]TDD11294.1 XRE family transcriptional regulator [Kribbella turkmenica]
MNDVLRRAMYDANLTDLDVSAKLAVDPKTVRRWMRGQMPHCRTREALTRLLGVDEEVIWPELRSIGSDDGRPTEIAGIYSRRTAISSQNWLWFFESAKSEVGILAYSALFLAEDARIMRLPSEKSGIVRIRIALGAPDSANVVERGVEEEIGEAMGAKIRNALALLGPLVSREGVELRLHDTVLYNSMFRSDDQLLVNQHSYGIPAAQSPVYHYRHMDDSEMFDSYVASFEAVWARGQVPSAAD